MVNYLRIGQDVCHAIRTRFPHISTTKYEALLKRQQMRFSFIENSASTLDTLSRAEIVNHNESINKITVTLDDMINVFKEVRSKNPDHYCYLKDILSAVPKDKKAIFANCGEESYVAEALLRTRGINASTASLKSTFYDDSIIEGLKMKHSIGIDHDVVVFNKNNEPFNGEIINNQTIIVDPWGNFVDYANNYLKKYRAILEKVFHIKYGNTDTPKADIEKAINEGFLNLEAKEQLRIPLEQLSELIKIYLG